MSGTNKADEFIHHIQTHMYTVYTYIYKHKHKKYPVVQLCTHMHAGIGPITHIHPPGFAPKPLL